MVVGGIDALVMHRISAIFGRISPFVLTVRITNDAREDEMEDRLLEMSGIVGNLRNMAIGMNREITAQNEQLDGINAQVSRNIPCSLVCDLLKSVIFYHLYDSTGW